jgi:hypothetical protein
MERMADRIVLVWNEPDANGEPVSGFALARPAAALCFRPTARASSVFVCSMLSACFVSM